MNRLAIAVVVALLVVPAVAQTTKPRSSDTADVIAAAQTFVLALGDPDTSSLKKQFAGTDEDFKLVELLHKVFQSANSLEAAATERWPDEMAKVPEMQRMHPKVLAARLKEDQLALNGDDATLRGGLRLHKTDGQWRVVDMVTSPKEKEMQLASLAPTITIADEVTAEIKQGKYNSFREAQNAIQERMKAAHAGFRSTRSEPTSRKAD